MITQQLVASATITLAVVTYREEETLLRLIDFIFQEESKHQPHEIIVVHNGGNNKTLQLLEDMKKKSPFPFCLCVHSFNHLGQARRLAVKKSQCDLIAFIDADCEPSVGWLAELKNSFIVLQKLYPALAGVGGPNRLPHTSYWQQAINLMLSSFLGHGGSPQGERSSIAKCVDHLPTTNVIFLKRALEEVGNFSPTLERICEDVEIGLRLNKHKFCLVSLPRPIVLNHCAHSYWDWGQRMFRFGRGQSLLMSPLRTSWHWPSLLSAIGFFLLLTSLIGGCLMAGYFPASEKKLFFSLLLFSYFSLIFIESLRIICCSLNKSLYALHFIFLLPFIFVVTHVSYGAGSFIGFIQRFFSFLFLDQYRKRSQNFTHFFDH